MRYVLSAEEMYRCDGNTMEQIGIPGMVLMERAALAARDRIFALCDAKSRVLVLVGTGNNGGDGLALARLLSETGYRVEIWCVGRKEKASEQWSRQHKILDAYDVIWCDKPKASEYTILVDALFGVGLSREVEGVYRQAIMQFNMLDGYKISLDVPSGISGDTGKVLGCAVQADETVTFGFAKRGLYLYPGCLNAGTVYIADIGINERGFCGQKPEMFCLDEVREWMPERIPEGNKASFGKILLIAGCEGMAGAAVLCAKAAYHAGAGMVKILTHESNRIVVQSSVPEAMYTTLDKIEEALDWADVVLIGPGLGKSEDAGKALEKVLDVKKPLLIDADGLNLLAQNGKWMQKLEKHRDRQVILTPHVGELARLTGHETDILKECLWIYGKELAQKLHAVIIAKDARTFVCCEGQPVCMNIHGNSGMAVAGSGDVLAGAVAGVWAQLKGRGLTGENAQEYAFRAACAGVRLHAAAGDAVAAVKGQYACVAGDIAEAIGTVGKSADS